MPDIDQDADTAGFTSYWSIKRVREPRARNGQELWRSWMTVVPGEALRLAKVPRINSISPGVIQDASRELAGHLGHRDPCLTLRVYCHLMPGTPGKMREAIDRAFSASPDCPGIAQEGETVR